MRIKIVNRINLMNRDENPKYYSQAENQGVAELNGLSQQITKYSSLSQGNILNVLDNMADTAVIFLRMGKAVRLGNLGMLRIVLKGKGAESPQDYTYNLIDHAKVKFTLSVKFKRELENITYNQ